MLETFAPTAVALRENPEILLRNRNPHGRLNFPPSRVYSLMRVFAATLGISDSKLAAVIEGGSYFVTSPNAENILAPLSSATRSLHLRKDGLWGADDPIRWPQIFAPTYCHFSAIPTRESQQANAAMLALWYDPTREDFICPTSGQSILRGCGKLPYPILEKLRGVLKQVQNQFDSLRASDKLPPLLPHLMQTAVHAISRLEALPTSYMQLLLTVRAFQRSLLEAIAIMDYKQIYQPRIAGLTGLHALVGVDPRMGAFTTDLRTVEDHRAAGLKVWFIQPSSSFRFQNILEIARLVVPETAIEMTLVNADATPTFTGNHMEKVDCIHHLTRKIGYTPDPFNDPPIAMESTAGPSRHQTSSASSRITQSAPYSKEHGRSAKLATAGRDKFKPVDSPYMPDYITGWKDALVSVNAHRPSRPRSPADGKYVFPDIALFCTPTSDDRKARYFTTWAYMRTALIYRAFGPAASAEPLTSQEWRDILNGGLFQLDSESRVVVMSKRGKPKVTKTRAKLLSLENILGPSLQHTSVSLDIGNKPETALPTAEQARAYLWEISELNFRLEFVALDKRLHVPPSTEPMSREQMIYSCFPGWTSAGFSLVDSDLRYAKQGLASQHWKEKLPFLLRLNAVMKSWAGYAASHIYILDQYDAKGVSALEFRLARFYTQCFFESFGRPATIPMALA
ncbi:hypothetical protein B0H11DRAFT_1939210 [Mycena galericulata]|nr:hypothetical protein B0H11DRAFT_1939210 [Mycena galericulata]